MEIKINTKGLDYFLKPFNPKENEKPSKKGLEVLSNYYKIIHNPLLNIIRQAPPSKWGSRIARRLMKIDKMENLDKEIRDFLDQYLYLIWDALRTPIQEGSIPRTAMYNVHEIDKNLPSEQQHGIDVKSISLEEICKLNPNIQIIKQKKYKVLQIKNIHDEDIQIPLYKNVYHKGGVSRLILKILFKSNLIASEVPLKDWDIIVPNSITGQNFLSIVKEEDLSGIETYPSLIKDKEQTLRKIMYGGDSTINLCLLGYDTFYYCDEAKKAAETGIIEPCSGDHGLYGRDFIVVTDSNGKKHKIIKGRVFERLAKMVVEKKAKAFRIKVENMQMNMGPSVFMGISRNINKPDRFYRIERFYKLLEKMGQIEQFKYVIKNRFGRECDSLFDWLDGVHEIFPFVELEKLKKEDGIAAWLMTRLIIWFRDHFKFINAYSERDMSWMELDSEEKTIEFDLEDFESDPALIKELEEGFPAFLERCRLRHQKMKEENNKIFNK